MFVAGGSVQRRKNERKSKMDSFGIISVPTDPEPGNERLLLILDVFFVGQMSKWKMFSVTATPRANMPPKR